jgi:serine/threonine protein kinase
VARSSEVAARFEQEAHAVNKFHHPGAVEISDIDVSEDGCPFLVMELLEGEDLGRMAERLGGVPTERLLALVDELLDVLAAAHGQGIVHRDVKLENLFVTHEGRLKVLDFGIARVRSGTVQTLAGSKLGTTSYMAPEQVRGRRGRPARRSVLGRRDDVSAAREASDPRGHLGYRPLAQDGARARAEALDGRRRGGSTPRPGRRSRA